MDAEGSDIYRRRRMKRMKRMKIFGGKERNGMGWGDWLYNSLIHHTCALVNCNMIIIILPLSREAEKARILKTRVYYHLLPSMTVLVICLFTYLVTVLSVQKLQILSHPLATSHRQNTT